MIIMQQTLLCTQRTYFGRSPYVTHLIIFLFCITIIGAISPNVVARSLGSTATAQSTITPLYAIQGPGPQSPFYQQWIDTYGLVTGVVADGFYLQDPLGDGDPLTSDGLFVYTRDAPTVQVGQCLYLQRAYVDEFYEKTELSRMKAILPSTQCATSTIEPVSIPHPRLGQEPVTQFEQFEGMVVEFEPLTAVVQGPTVHFADGERELALLAADLLPYIEAGRVFQADAAAMHGLLYLTNALGATLPEARQGDMLWIGDVNAAGTETVAVNSTEDSSTAARASTKVQAIIDYNFGKYQLLLRPDTPLEKAALPSGRTSVDLKSLSAPPATEHAFSVCTYNLHGMGRGSEQYWQPQEYDRQLAKRALTIAELLGGCTIIGLQEAGTPEDVTRLAAFLEQNFALSYNAVALPGPGTLSNEFPLTLALLARRNRVTVREAVQRQGCSATDYDVVRLAGDCDAGMFPLFNRPPFVVTMAVTGTWDGPEKSAFPVQVIGNHWKSKGGDETVNVVRRTAQATHVAMLVQEQLTGDPTANVIVLGDLNDYYQSGPIDLLRTGTLPALHHSYDALSPLDRYTYIFNGGSQALDHILVTPNLATRIGRVMPVRVNVDYPAGDNARVLALQRSSDHDPVALYIEPTGVGIVGGNLGYPHVTVTLTSVATATVAVTETSVAPGGVAERETVVGYHDAGQPLVRQATTDRLGEFRLWSVPPGEYHLHIDAPAHFNESAQTGILSVEAGYQTLSPVILEHTAIEHAAAMLQIAPVILQQRR